VNGVMYACDGDAHILWLTITLARAHVLVQYLMHANQSYLLHQDTNVALER